MIEESEYPNCPYCGHRLHCGIEIDMNGQIVPLYWCNNWDCESSEDFVGSLEFWDAYARYKRLYETAAAGLELALRNSKGVDNYVELSNIKKELKRISNGN